MRPTWPRPAADAVGAEHRRGNPGGTAARGAATGRPDDAVSIRVAGAAKGIFIGG
jgi:hypothetical protein